MGVVEIGLSATAIMWLICTLILIAAILII